VRSAIDHIQWRWHEIVMNAKSALSVILNRSSSPGLTRLDPAIHPFRKKLDARVEARA
jgi:hypothetical protein